MKSFSEQVVVALADYMNVLGFEVCAQTNESVAFESTTKRVIVQLGEDHYSFDVDGEVALKSRLYEPARFSEVARVLKKSTVMPFLTRDVAQLKKGIDAIASFIKNELGSALNGSDNELESLLFAVEDLRQKETDGYAFASLRQKASEAWKKKDFARVVESYLEMKDALNESEKRRLAYAETKLESTS